MCHQCCVSQANRRQIAFILEGPISIAVMVGYVMVCSLLLRALGPGASGSSSHGIAGLVVLGGIFLLYVLAPLRRDCTFFGALGKRICGVRAVDRDTFEPIGAVASFKRNLVLYVPLATLIVGNGLVKAGPRCGDGWANSVVLRKRDLDHPVFHGAKTCHECWGVYDPAEPDGCLGCAPATGRNAA